MRIPAFRLKPEPLEEAAAQLKPFQWAGDDIGRRHQLGGDPTFEQDAEWPSCPHCNEPMTFYAQLDSINDDICIADCGMIYVFVCLDDNEATAIVQSF
jgi:hypothetical protein